jgi:phosphoribosylformylglycinamidine (FGAM) synthase-like amidotransferase family enzyme
MNVDPRDLVDSNRAAQVRVLVMTGYGLNCEAETAHAFTMFGAQVVARHVGDLLADAEVGRDPLSNVDILAFIGGFSFGDHVASGRVFANRLAHRLGEALRGFAARGGLAIGVCNGFQTMVKLGILPNDAAGGDTTSKRGSAAGSNRPFEQTVTLFANERLGYYDGWVRLLADEHSPCVWTRGVSLIDVPSRHGEGRLVFSSEAQRQRLEAGHQIPLRYVDESGSPTTAWPANPNGSPGGAAALCDASGRLFGVMPHPEAHLYVENHPDWRRRGASATGLGDGARLFANGINAAIAAR